MVNTWTPESRTICFSTSSRLRTPSSTVRSGATDGTAPPISTSWRGPLPRHTASGMPWTLPEGLVSGEFMSAWASTQIKPSGTSAARAAAAVPATEPTARLWSPPTTIGMHDPARLRLTLS